MAIQQHDQVDVKHPELAQHKKPRSWRAKTALAVGVGVPLGVIALAEPAAAERESRSNADNREDINTDSTADDGPTLQDADVTGEASFDNPGYTVASNTSTRTTAVDDQYSTTTNVQQRLNSLGYNAGPVDGISGPKTRAAIAAFQRANQLPVTQRVDSATKRALAGDAARNTQTTTQQNTQLSTLTSVQKRLNALSYWTGTPDGLYGSMTRNAILAFQKAERLPLTGKADASTRARLSTASRPTTQTRTRGSRVTVDTSRQIVQIWKNGDIVYTLNTSTGRPGVETSKGSWKMEWQVDGVRTSSFGKLYRPKYFHTRGLAIHGSPNVRNYPDSAGCVRVTNAAMDLIWASGLVDHGTPIVVT